VYSVADEDVLSLNGGNIFASFTNNPGDTKSLFRKPPALVLRRPEGASKDDSRRRRRRRKRPPEHPSRPFAFAKGASG
jgi:hypothetical protein